MEYKYKEENPNNAAMGTIVAGALGAILGAAAVLFTHEPTRRKVKKNINNFLTESEKKMNDIQDKVEETANEGRKKVAEQLEEAKSKIDVPDGEKPENGIKPKKRSI